MVMASFDVESLFTNIPLQETINICMSSLFSSTGEVLGISSKYFRMLLELAVTSSYFIFNDKFYCQKEGVGMGLPLGPTFADIFMCFYEKQWLSTCPPEFAPVFYLEDMWTIVLFSSHADMFLLMNPSHADMFTLFGSARPGISVLSKYSVQPKLRLIVDYTSRDVLRAYGN